MRARPLRLLPLAAALLASPGSTQVASTAPAAVAGGIAPDALPVTPRSLPSLPLPAGSKVMVFGDSLSGWNHSAGEYVNGGVTTGAASTRMSGLFVTAWAADPRFNFDAWYDPADPWRAQVGLPNRGFGGANQGIFGDHLVNAPNTPGGTGIVTRVRYALSRGPALVWINAGTNTISSCDWPTQGVTGSESCRASYITARLDGIVRQFTSRGVWVILSTLYPRGDWTTGDARHETLRQVNAWVRAQNGRAGVRVMDPYDALVAPDDPDGVRGELFEEGAQGVHPNPAGAWAIYRGYLKPLLDAMIAPGAVFDPDPTVANLLPGATALMNGGTAGGRATGTTGVVATGFGTQGAIGGDAIVGAIEDAGAYKRQVLTITPVNDATPQAYHRIQLTIPQWSSGLPAAGSWVRAYLHVETPEPASASTITYLLTVLNGSATLATPGGHVATGQSFDDPGVGRGGYWIEVPPFLMPAGATRVTGTVTITWPKAMATPFTIKLDRLIVRSAADPRGAWGATP
jgi:lysophospholipase L1-like esterase